MYYNNFWISQKSSDLYKEGSSDNDDLSKKRKRPHSSQNETDIFKKSETSHENFIFQASIPHNQRKEKEYQSNKKQKKKESLPQKKKEKEGETVFFKCRPVLANILKAYNWVSKKEIKRIIESYIIENDLYNKKTELFEVSK